MQALYDEIEQLRAHNKRLQEEGTLLSGKVEEARRKTANEAAAAVQA